MFLYRFVETVLWLSVAIPIAGFGYCMVIEHYGEGGLIRSRVRWGLLCGAVAALAHLAQAVGLNLSVANRSREFGQLLGVLWLVVPAVGVVLAVLALVQIRAHDDHEVRRAGTASAVIAGGSMAVLVLLFFLGLGTA